MTTHAKTLIVAVLACSSALWSQESPKPPRIYVPQKDLADLIHPPAKAVLMDRPAFEKLLAEAKARLDKDEGLPIGQITDARYDAAVSGESVAIAGEMTLVSMSDKTVAVRLGFSRLALTKLELDGKPAPLGYDNGRLIVLVTARGKHKLTLAAETVLKELPRGGMHLGISLPPAVAATMNLSAPGDLDFLATTACTQPQYDKLADRTTAELTLGGQSTVTVILAGNGRRQDERAILIGESATTVELTGGHPVMDCLYTVQVLRRGASELRFSLPASYTVTNVACPNLVRWSVRPAGKVKHLIVQLRATGPGTRALHVKATGAALGAAAKWQAPQVRLIGAAFQRGYLLVDPGKEVRIRAERLTDSRREDRSVAAAVEGMSAALTGRLYYHWGDAWDVRVDLTRMALRREGEVRQLIVVSAREIALSAHFEVTAVGRELFDVELLLPDEKRRWHLSGVTVNGKTAGFTYQVRSVGGERVLRIELARPVLPEGLARVGVELRHVPAVWNWATDAAPREVDVPLIGMRSETVSGLVALSARDDLDVTATATPQELKPVTVGRMTSLKLNRTWQSAYTYEAAPQGAIRLRVARRTARLSAAAVGLITATTRTLSGDWSITYHITRARAEKLYLLAAKSLGREIDITAPGRRLASRQIVADPPKDVPKGYNLWELNLDSRAGGDVKVRVHYDRPAGGETFAPPLVRPWAERTSEMLAVQAAQELAVDVAAKGATQVDTIELGDLGARAGRMLAAFRLQGPRTARGAAAAVTLTATVHAKYAIPPALVVEADATTCLGSDGSQRTDATFKIVNAGMQFLAFGLPKGGSLLSAQVDGKPAKPKRNAAGSYLLALPRTDKPLPVRILYTCGGGQTDISRVTLGKVDLGDVEINAVRWHVYPPPGYRVTSREAEMLASHKPTPALISIWRGRRALLAPIQMGVDLAGSHEGDYVPFKSAARPAAPEEVDDIFVAESGESRIEAPDGAEAPMPPKAKGTRARPKAEPKKKPTTQPAVTVTDLSGSMRLDERLVMQGRYTLPIELGITPGSTAVEFTSLGQQEIEVELTGVSGIDGWWAVGFAGVALVGLGLLRRTVRARIRWIVLAAMVSALVGLWCAPLVYAANGAFVAAMALIPFYLVWALLRLILRAIGVVECRCPSRSVATAAAVMFVMVLSASARGGAAKPTKPAPPTADPPIIVPYEGDPTEAHKSAKVLVPYARFVRLWNQAHPDSPIVLPGEAAARVALADVRYQIDVTQKRVELTLTGQVRTYDNKPAQLPLGMANLAVTSLTLDGKPARLYAGPTGLVVTLRADRPARMVLKAVTTPKWLGRRGSVELTLPPLPAAVVTVALPAADLDLEAPGLDSPPRRVKKDGPQWSLAMGLHRKLSLRWSPSAGGGSADKTLSAAAAHNVYAYHWALMGTSKVAFTFSAAEYDRFAILVPEGVTLTDLSGANVRDRRVTGKKQIAGRAYRVVQVRLHRPAAKRYELTARWVAPLGKLDGDVVLPLVQAADVARESGTVSLHAAGGMNVKVAGVTGGRRSRTATAKQTGETGGRARPVGQYYWPYRPFSMTVRLSRPAVTPTVALDQLVRVTTERVELLVRGRLSTRRGRIFAAGFTLPDGYELLSVVGEAVGDFHVQPTPQGRRLHVNLRRGVQQSEVALVLVRKSPPPARLAVPAVRAIDAAGEVPAKQTGRLAVQMSASLAASTAASENLRSIVPRAVRDWLDAAQVRDVQFAYRYETPRFSLALNVRPHAKKVRAEVFGGLSVSATAASYAYRLRYHIEGSPIDRVRFMLPKRYAPLAAVASPSMRSVSHRPVAQKPEWVEWTVELVNEVTGLLDVTVNFALPIGLDTQSLEMPLIRTDAPGGYRAVLAVQNLSRHRLALTAEKNLSPLPVTQQMSLLNQQVRNSLQYVFQSFSDDWSMALSLEPAQVAKRIQAVVDLLEMTTAIDPSGHCRYEVRLYMQNRSEQFLRLRLPEGLKLWSATVAEQAVKPVTPANAEPGEVLIPLIKTSPGGLPYDVRAYLAGRVVEKFGRATKITPPAVGVVGIPVKRTTWALRLPRGYRYVRPGGNMSLVSSKGEMLIIAQEARLGQVQSFQASSNLLVLSPLASDRDRATWNWKAVNERLTKQTRQVQEYLEANRYQMGRGEYQRLNQSAWDNSSSQTGLLGVWAKNIDEQRKLIQGDVTFAVNSDAVNPGTAEANRNQALAQMPSFLRSAAQRQREQLANELKASVAAQQRPRQHRPGTRGDAQQARRALLVAELQELQKKHHKLTEDYRDKLAKRDKTEVNGRRLELAAGVLRHQLENRRRSIEELGKKIKGLQDRATPQPQPQTEDAVGNLLEGLKEQQEGQLARQRDELKKQLDSLADSRVGRFYVQPGEDRPSSPGKGGKATFGSYAGKIKVPGFRGPRVDLSKTHAEGRRGPDAGPVTKSTGGGKVGGIASAGDGMVRWGTANGPVSRIRPSNHERDGEAMLLTNGSGRFSRQLGGAHVARGTLSLPVTLPEQGVELYFAHPSDQPEITLWVVREDVVTGGYGTAVVAGVLAAILIVLLFRRLIRRARAH